MAINQLVDSGQPKKKTFIKRNRDNVLTARCDMLAYISSNQLHNVQSCVEVNFTNELNI